jgi:hypothetical protein
MIFSPDSLFSPPALADYSQLFSINYLRWPLSRRCAGRRHAAAISISFHCFRFHYAAFRRRRRRYFDITPIIGCSSLRCHAGCQRMPRGARSDARLQRARYRSVARDAVRRGASAYAIWRGARATPLRAAALAPRCRQRAAPGRYRFIFRRDAALAAIAADFERCCRRYAMRSFALSPLMLFRDADFADTLPCRRLADYYCRRHYADCCRHIDARQISSLSPIFSRCHAS